MFDLIINLLCEAFDLDHKKWPEVECQPPRLVGDAAQRAAAARVPRTTPTPAALPIANTRPQGSTLANTTTTRSRLRSPRYALATSVTRPITNPLCAALFVLTLVAHSISNLFSMQNDTLTDLQMTDAIGTTFVAVWRSVVWFTGSDTGRRSRGREL